MNPLGRSKNESVIRDLSAMEEFQGDTLQTVEEQWTEFLHLFLHSKGLSEAIE